MKTNGQIIYILFLKLNPFDSACQINLMDPFLISINKSKCFINFFKKAIALFQIKYFNVHVYLINYYVILSHWISCIIYILFIGYGSRLMIHVSYS